MTTPKTSSLIAATLPIAFVAALLNQMGHEAFHAIAVLLTGAKLLFYNLFAVNHAWDGSANANADLIIAANAALVNILIAFICIGLFSQPWLKQRSGWRLFVFYLGAYNLFTGFGYLMVDPLFYQPGAVGDWKFVIDVLGGGWGVRLPIMLVGMAGVLYGFFWIPRSIQQFMPDPGDKSSRVRFSMAALLVPYLVINTVMTILSIWHPLGGSTGVFIVVSHYWFGYFAIAWGFPMSALWLTRSLPPKHETTPVPTGLNPRWLAAAVVLFIIALFLIFPVPQI